MQPAMAAASAAAGAALQAVAAEPPRDVSAPGPSSTTVNPVPQPAAVKAPVRTTKPSSRKTKKGDPQLDVRD
jgi:hypothetical protein